MTTRRISDVFAGDRHRLDLGDLEVLAQSIRDRGLLQPIAITPDGKLVAGQRRLEACRRLGWEHVPVHVLSNLDDARDRLLAERDENTCRLDMSLSEKVSLGRALEALERPKAKERQGTRNDLNNILVTGPECCQTTRDVVAAALGLSSSTYQRAKAVVVAADDESLSEDKREIAVRAKRMMDVTGKVVTAYREVVTVLGSSKGPTTNGNKKQPARSREASSPSRAGPISTFWKRVKALDDVLREPEEEEWLHTVKRRARARLLRRLIATLTQKCEAYEREDS